MPAAKTEDRTLTTLRATFETSYGRAFRGRLLSHGILPDIIRGLAFSQLAAQDDAVDTRAVLVKLEAAVTAFCAELKISE